MNGPLTILPSATRTASVNNTAGTGDMPCPRERGVHVIIDITSLNAGTPSITVTIEGKDPLSGKYFTLVASAALAAVATTILRVYPGLVAAANLTANDIVPSTWRVKVINADSQPITYSVGAQLIV